MPESCCVDGKSKVLCQGNNEKYDGPPVYGPPNTDYREHKDNPALHTNVSILFMRFDLRKMLLDFLKVTVVNNIFFLIRFTTIHMYSSVSRHTLLYYFEFIHVFQIFMTYIVML